MGRLGTHAVYASPGGSPHRTQDSLPAVGQTLPGGLEAHWVPPKGFFDASYIAFLLSQAFPGASALRSHRPRSVGLKRDGRGPQRQALGVAGRGEPRRAGEVRGHLRRLSVFWCSMGFRVVVSCSHLPGRTKLQGETISREFTAKGRQFRPTGIRCLRRPGIRI